MCSDKWRLGNQYARRPTERAPPGAVDDRRWVTSARALSPGHRPGEPTSALEHRARAGRRSLRRDRTPGPGVPDGCEGKGCACLVGGAAGGVRVVCRWPTPFVCSELAKWRHLSHREWEGCFHRAPRREIHLGPCGSARWYVVRWNG